MGNSRNEYFFITGQINVSPFGFCGHAISYEPIIFTDFENLLSYKFPFGLLCPVFVSYSRKWCTGIFTKSYFVGSNEEQK